MKHILLIFLFSLNAAAFIYGQSSVAITIDDIPNTIKYQQDNYQSKLLTKLDSLNVPVLIFINEGKIYDNEKVSKNVELLEKWISKNYITVGTHTFSHSRYSDVGIDSFKIDIEKGKTISRKLAQKYGKQIKYFRFPYNDLGKDSAQHAEIAEYLASQNYISTPFTIESADWVYNYIYQYYLDKNDLAKANVIAKEYILKTLEYFNYIDSIALKNYGRKIKQIYLCHDNSINADYLPTLLNEMKKKNYSFISIDEALRDDVYKQKDLYNKKWGISWVYRWMKNQKDVSKLVNDEPDTNIIYFLYQQILEDQKKK